jgi:hypothetical protein
MPFPVNQCPFCKVSNVGYFPEFKFYDCFECGHSWGGCIEGLDLNNAWTLVQFTFAPHKLALTRAETHTDEYEREVVDAYQIALSNLRETARVLECNLGLKNLPNNPKWWIQHQDNIENKLLGIEN